MSETSESTDVKVPVQEIKKIPSARNLARANILAHYWDKPLSALSPDNRVLPGVQERFLPEGSDRERTLGNFLTDGSSELRTFGDFVDQYTSGDRQNVRKVMQGFRTIFPTPEELLQENPQLLQWVPWETFIAYGDALQSQKEPDEEAVASVVVGEEFLGKVRERFPKGHPNKRTEIVLERQNKDPKSQGVLEAVSNSVDAISDREKIGQFGLGVKQIFTWLEKGKGEVRVTSKTTDGEILSLCARKGFDDQVYIKFAPPTTEEQEQFADDRTGTRITIRDIAVDETVRESLDTKLHDRFQYVPETTINVNGTAINGHDRIKIIGRETPITPKGHIDVTIAAESIVISDTGTGMDKDMLFKMFLPGYGKGYHPISAAEAQELAVHQAEVLLKETDTPQIVFSRNREADLTFALPEDRLNLAQKSICVELGRILKVSEGRDGFEIDDNFAVALPILVEKTLSDGSITDTEKTAFLNSLLLGIDQFSSSRGSQTADKLLAVVRKTKKGIRASALPFLQHLRNDNTLLLPNYTSYQKVTGEAQFVDPYLLEGFGSLATVLQAEGMTLHRGNDGIVTKDGWKMFTTSLTPNEDTEQLTTQLQSGDKLIALREKLNEVLPVVIDREHRVIIVDQALWQRIVEEADPIRKAYLQETLQAIINEKVHTSYEAKDPRSLFIQDPHRTVDNSEGISEEQEIGIEYMAYERLANGVTWRTNDYLCNLDKSGVLKRYDRNTLALVDAIEIPEIAWEDGSCPLQMTADGAFVMPPGGKLLFFDQTGQIKETYDVREATKHVWSLCPDGKLLYKLRGSFLETPGSPPFHLYSFDPRTGQKQLELSVDMNGLDNIRDFFVTDDNKLAYIQQERFPTGGRTAQDIWKIVVVDKKTGTRAVSSEAIFELRGNIYQVKDLTAIKDKIYAVGTNPDQGYVLLEVRQDNEKLTFHPLIRDKQNYFPDLTNVTQETLPHANLSLQLGDRIIFYDADALGTHTQEESVIFWQHRIDQPVIASAVRGIKGFLKDDQFTDYNSIFPLFQERLRGNTLIANDVTVGKFLEGVRERTKQFLTLLASDQMRNVFTSVWEPLQASETIEDCERMKMRFIGNAPLLLEIPRERLTPEAMQLFFLSDNPQIFFDLSETQQEKLFKVLNGIEDLSQKEGLVKLITLVTRQKTPEEVTTFYAQLDKLMQKVQIKNAFLQAIDENKDSLQIMTFSPTELPKTNNLRSYLLFINGEADLIRSKEQSAATDGFQDILPGQIPLELLAYFRLTDGLHDINAINERIAQEGGIEALVGKLNLSHYQDEIRKAIHAQSVEPGVAKRELLQNAISAIRQKGTNTGAIAVDFYLRSNGEEYVEEIKDTGTGIENLIPFLVPGVTTKEAKEGLGIFGTGLYKAFEDVDHIEVDSVKKGTSHNQAERIIIDLIKDDAGQVQGGVVREIKTKEVSALTETGTTLRLIRSTQDSLPELEAMIAKNTYLTMGALATDARIADIAIDSSFINDTGNKEPATVPITEMSTLPLEHTGTLTFVKAPLLPASMTSRGLRMSALNQTASDYLRDVPDPLKKFLLDEHVSVILPKEVPLVKDRSSIAGEEEYLPEIQRAIATESIKRAAYGLLSDTPVPLRGLVPDDILSNPDYYTTLTSETGSRSYAISQKINDNMLLTPEELSFLQNKNNLLLVLLSVEKQIDGKKDSLFRRFQYIQAKAGNMVSVDFDTAETAVSPQLAQEEQRVVSQAEWYQRVHQDIAKLNSALDRQEIPPGVTALAQTQLDAQEKEFLTQYFSTLGLEEVYFVPGNLLQAGGVHIGNRFLLSAGLLHDSPRNRCETIIHESSHLFETKADKKTSGQFDLNIDASNNFTHQSEGPFAQYYRIAADIMQQQLVAA